MSRFEILVEALAKEPIQFMDKNKIHYPTEYHYSILDMRSHEPANTLSKTHINALTDYTIDSQPLNKKLWSGKSNNISEHLTKHISEALKTAPAAKNDLTVYTGVNATRNTLKKGDLHIPAYTSTSPDIHVAAAFAKHRFTIEDTTDDNGTQIQHKVHHIIRINIKKGQHVGAYIASHSDNSNEHEFLINKGHTIHLDGTYEDHKQDVVYPYKNTTIRIHNATITPDEE